LQRIKTEEHQEYTKLTEGTTSPNLKHRNCNLNRSSRNYTTFKESYGTTAKNKIISDPTPTNYIFVKNERADFKIVYEFQARNYENKEK
jgi:hypothetical protein